MTAFWVQVPGQDADKNLGCWAGRLGWTRLYIIPAVTNFNPVYSTSRTPSWSQTDLNEIISTIHEPPVGGGTLITIFPAVYEEGTGLMCHRRVLVLPDSTIILATLHLLSGTHLFTQNEAITETGHPSIGCRTWSGIPTIHLDWFPQSHRVRRTAPSL
ncbi:unnamed protein product [Fusarium graminearum]|uniref:Uncharacterized protein n=1 Tax=Gibberella zeae TaxID=5518 RepID=A0A4E9DA35_GIBZA|nr:unnamed protein product [Fusarium graminearum]CAG1994836.1 unnamed protein product [Fusarium graminearum]CAG2006171.1 unnamed protein product [Fusarium graminearum]